MSEDIDLSSEIILQGNPETPDDLCKYPSQGLINILDERPGYLKIEADNLDRGWIFWSQTWYPGWIIKIDGVKTGPALRANYLFQAAEVQPGVSQVEFIYAPISFKIGAVLTAVTLLLAVYKLKTGKKKN